MTAANRQPQDWSDRETAMAARIVVVLRDCRSVREAINVVALAAKTVVEDEPRLRLYEWSRR